MSIPTYEPPTVKRAARSTSDSLSPLAQTPPSASPSEIVRSGVSHHCMPLRSKPSTAEDLPEERRPGVQFAVRQAEADLRTDHPGPARLKLPRRLSSPPPPSTYESRVSFDTFDNRDATDFSFSLRARHRHYNYTKRSRTFLCGTDQNDYSEFALEWLLEELVDDGDEVVCLRVVDKDSKLNSDSSLEEQRYRTEARHLMEQIQAKTKDDNKSISLTLEFAVGKVQDTIQHMIAVYEPACLIVGTRGRSLNGIQGLLPGSVSKYCLQNSPVPVIVVRPSSKREKKKQKRRADPSRRAYIDILEKSGARGGQVLNRAELDKYVGPMLAPATMEEAEATAKATGISDSFLHPACTNSTCNGPEASSSPDSSSPAERTNLDSSLEVPGSPDLGRLDTSDVSEGDDLNAEDAAETSTQETSPLRKDNSKETLLA